MRSAGRRLPLLILAGLLGATVVPPGHADAVSVDGKGRTDLMVAARDGDLARVETLLAAGAEIDARNPNGGTPLMYAALGGSAALVERLLSAGADVDARASNGWGALMIAAAKGHADVARVLIGAGADVNAQDVYGWTPLMRACYENRPSVVNVLLEAPGVALEAREERGATALHVVAQTGNERFAQQLLEHGADREARTRDGLTPADIAERARHGALRTLLAGGG
ncbi:MAG: ankyrin repeat domain-containing protein [Planctomycetes bacterium]|nr:ankyrin repeat domain-containing protein [Planctomycetota bacterium]